MLWPEDAQRAVVAALAQVVCEGVEEGLQGEVAPERVAAADEYRGAELRDLPGPGCDQRRLADSGLAAELHQPRRPARDQTHLRAQRGELFIATDEAALIGGRSLRRLHCAEQHRGVQRLGLRARIHAERLDEHLAGECIGGECCGRSLRSHVSTHHDAQRDLVVRLVVERGLPQRGRLAGIARGQCPLGRDHPCACHEPCDAKSLAVGPLAVVPGEW